MTDTEIATAMSRKSWPTSRSIARIGTNTSTVVSAETRMAPQTWLAPRSAASRGGTPRSRRR